MNRPPTRWLFFMPGELIDNVVTLINNSKMQIGDKVSKTANGGTATASVPLYSDSTSTLAVGGFPFAVPFIAGATNTSAAAFNIEGSSTGSADQIFNQTLVSGANVTTATKQVFVRVNVTDDAGNITNGNYYLQLSSLS